MRTYRHAKDEFTFMADTIINDFSRHCGTLENFKIDAFKQLLIEHLIEIVENFDGIIQDTD